MMDPSRETLKPDDRELKDARANHHARLALALGIVAVALALALGFVYFRSVRRLEHEMAEVKQQTQEFSRVLQQAQEQSQVLAQQASQAATNAQAAAQQRDLAKQAQSTSEEQARLAQQQAADEKQKAAQATQQAEEYRKAQEAQLAQLQQALGEIAETHRTAMGLIMTLDSKSIRFDFDRATIKPEYRDVLNRIAGILMTVKGYTIAVYGYTDDVGTPSYNLQLSQRRAEAVRDFLVQAGIPAKIVSIRGFGASDPRVQGDSEEARAANRRVEIAIVNSKLVTDGLAEPK